MLDNITIFYGPINFLHHKLFSYVLVEWSVHIKCISFTPFAYNCRWTDLFDSCARFLCAHNSWGVAKLINEISIWLKRTISLRFKNCSLCLPRDLLIRLVFQMSFLNFNDEEFKFSRGKKRATSWQLLGNGDSWNINTSMCLTWFDWSRSVCALASVKPNH